MSPPAGWNISSLSSFYLLLFYQDPENNIVGMFYNSDFTAVLGFMDQVDSCFYMQLLSAELFALQSNAEMISILDKLFALRTNAEMISILDKVEPFKLVPSKENSFRKSVFRRVAEIRPRDNIGLDFFCAQSD